MKHLLLLIALIISGISSAQFQVHTVQVATNDLVYDSVTDRIYVSIPSANGTNGNSLGVINPYNYTLENTIFIGSEPTVLAISDNGEYIYSGFSGSSTVRRFEVATQTAGLQFSLGSETNSGAYYVEDIEVMPGQSSTIAISRRNMGLSPKHEGVVIYDNDVMRPTSTPDHTGSNQIEFIKDGVLIGYNNESTEYGLRKMAVNNSGVNILSVNQSILYGFGLDFTYYNNHIYATNGQVVNVGTAPFVIGEFSDVSGPVAYDSYMNKVCYANYDYYGNITFKRFSPDTFLLSDAMPIPQASGDVKNIITCGNGCYAFNTTDDEVVILRDGSMAVSTFSKNKISIYPNPAAGYIALSSDTDIKEVKIFDISGRLVNNFQDNFENIYLGNLNKGIYIAKIKDIYENTFTEKIVKK